MRELMSWPPPAPSPTTKVIGRWGKSCELTGAANSAAATTQARPIHRVIISPSQSSRRGCLPLRFEPFAEMREGARIRNFRHRLVVGIGTAMIGKCMNHAGIDKGLHVRIAGNGREDLPLQELRRRGVIELAEVQDQRPGDGLALG